MEPNLDANPDPEGDDKRRSLLFVDFDPLLPARQQHHVDRFTINRHAQLGRFRKHRAAATQIERQSCTPSTRSSQQGPARPTTSGSADDEGLIVSPMAKKGSQDIRRVQEVSESSQKSSAEPSPSIWTFLDNASIDPFATSAIPLNKKMNELLNHWLERTRHCPFVIQDQWLRQQIMPLVLAEPSVLFAMLGFAAADMVARNGAELGKSKGSAIQRAPEVVTFKTRAIHFLSQKLKDPEEAVKPSLAVLWAVTYVCVIEFFSNNNAELKIHLSGVRRIIELCGGFHTFSPIIIYWILGAWRVLPHSSAAPPPLMRRETVPLKVISAPLHPGQRMVGLALLGSEHVEHFDNRLVQAIRDLREITLWYEFIAVSDHESPITDANYYNDLQLQTQYALFSSASGQQEGPSDDVQEACRIGLLIYAYSPSLPRRSVTAMIQKLELEPLGVMYRCFLRVEAQPDIARGELLMWALFLTAYAFNDEPEWSGIKALLARTGRRLGLVDWEAVRSRLLGFLYTDRVYQELYRMTWMEAMKV